MYVVTDGRNQISKIWKYNEISRKRYICSYSYVGIYTMVMSYIKGVARHTYIFICIHLRTGIYASYTTNHGVYDKYVSLCVGGSKGKVGIQISCIPESRDTCSCILGKIYP